MLCVSLHAAAGSGKAKELLTETVLIHLDVEERFQPAYVCIISDVGKGPTLQELSPVRDRDEWHLAAKWTCSKTASRENCEAFKGLIHSDDEQADAQCLPSVVDFPDERKIDCAANRQGVKGRRGTAMLGVGLALLGEDDAKPGVDKIVLDGSLVQLKLSGFKIPMGQLTVRALGGEYSAPPKSETTLKLGDQHHASLTLRPRCVEHELVLPGRQSGPLHVTLVEESGTPGGGVGESLPLVDRTVKAEDGRARILLPRTADGKQKTLHATVGSTQLRKSWQSSEPERLISLDLNQFTLRWRRHCMYSEPECPKAWLVNQGGQCSKPRINGDVCEYTCGDESVTGYVLPQPVRFTAPNTGAWEEVLNRPDETVDGYVDASRWRVVVDVPEPDAKILRRSWDRVESIELQAAGSPRVAIFTPQGGERIRIPGAECGTRVQYQLVGDRTYASGQTIINSGRMEVLLRQNDRPFRFWPAIGLGGIAASKGFFPAVSVEANLRVHPTDWRVASEAHVGAIVSEREYDDISLDQTKAAKVGYIRIPVGLRAFWLQGPAFQIGGGGGIQFGHPLYQSDVARAGGWDTSAFASIIGRFRLFNSGWLFADLRLISFEERKSHLTDYTSRSRGAYRGEESVLITLGTVFGL